MADRDAFMADVKHPGPNLTAEEQRALAWAAGWMQLHADRALNDFRYNLLDSARNKLREESDWESELVVFDRIGAGEAFHVVLDDGTEIAAPMKELVRVMGPSAPGLYGTEAA